MAAQPQTLGIFWILKSARVSFLASAFKCLGDRDKGPFEVSSSARRSRHKKARTRNVAILERSAILNFIGFHILC